MRRPSPSRSRIASRCWSNWARNGCSVFSYRLCSASAPFDSGYQLFPRALADITVSGASAITATPSAWDFASVNVGGSAFKSFTITNTSGSAVTLTTPFTIGGANADQFTVGLPGTTTLAPSGSTSVSVTFQPTTAGAKAATLTIASSGGLAVVALTGNGQAAAGAGTAVVISEFRFRGASERRLAGASEVRLAGASERSFVGASETMLAGASERVWGGGSERLGGASERSGGGSGAAYAGGGAGAAYEHDPNSPYPAPPREHK